MPLSQLTPAEQVLAQLGRQKWAVDARDAEALRGLYTAGSEQVIYRGGPQGRTEIARSHGRDEIISGITAGWARTAATWYPGATIHLIGSHVIDPLGEGRMRCRSYAAYLGLDAAGTPVLKSYGAYDDVWASEEGEWRLAYRETVMYGRAPAVTFDPASSELNWFTDSAKTRSHSPSPARSPRSAHMGKLDGKVAVVTGAARGQGRSHAVTLAQAGADIIALDICGDIENVKYPLARPADLEETQRLVEKLDRRVVTYQADVREPSQVRAAVDSGVRELGRLDIVVANAGIAPLGPGLPGGAFLDAVNVNFAGVVNLVTAAYPHLEAGASIIATGSVAAMLRGATDLNQQGPGGAGYSLSKREVARFVHDLALTLAPESIRVNAVHPGNVNTDMLHNRPMYKIFRPDLEAATLEDFEPASAAMFPLPISWLEPRDISAAVVFLASDDARYITGQQLRVDGGVALKHTPALPNS